jgi:hypothetical protein
MPTCNEEAPPLSSDEHSDGFDIKTRASNKVDNKNLYSFCGVEHFDCRSHANGFPVDRDSTTAMERMASIISTWEL